MQVFSCLALSVPIGVRSDFAPDDSPHFLVLSSCKNLAWLFSWGWWLVLG